MPSPFPGMDPYLEGDYWTTLHFALAAEIVRQLRPQLPRRYILLPHKRFVMDSLDEGEEGTSDAYPDLALRRTDFIAEAGTTWPAKEGASWATEPAEDSPVVTPPLLMETVVPPQVPYVHIEIRDTRSRQLVTAIEILSPSNKRGTSRGRYLAKRQRILLSSAHLLEIDLLRKGRRVPMKEELPPQASYFVFLTRAECGLMSEVWPIALAEPLPTVPVPLLDDDEDLALDLQSAFTSAYDLLQYEREIDYRQPPDVPLAPAQAAWAHELLRSP